MPTRRDLLIAAAASSLPRIITSGVAGPTAAATVASAREDQWDQGRLAHLLPTVSHDRFLIKASFDHPLAAAPELSVGATRVRGQRNPGDGSFWQFDAPGLEPSTIYQLSLTAEDGRALCEPWPLATFPAPDSMPPRLRVMIYTCGGGHDALNAGLPEGKINWLPSALRRRLLARGLSFKPDALIANGDQIYWDLLAPRASKGSGASAQGIAFAGRFDRAQPVFGGANEAPFLRATGPQIVPQYGALCRSTPVFFMQDDHDYFDNDEATDEIITFPPDQFMLNLARATRQLYYPEYLPDPERPLGLPGASAAVTARGGGGLRDLALRPARGDPALRHPALADARGAQRSLCGRHGGGLAQGAHGGARGSARRQHSLQPSGLERRQMGRVVSRHPRPRRPAHRRHAQALLAERLAQAARPSDGCGRRHAGPHPARHQRRSACHCRGPDAAQRRARLQPQSHRRHSLRPARHRRPWLALGLPRHRRIAAAASANEGEPQADRGERLHHRDFTTDGITIRFFRFNYHRQSADEIDTLEPFRVTELKRPG